MLLLIDALEREDPTTLGEIETPALVNLYTLLSDVQRNANDLRKDVMSLPRLKSWASHAVGTHTAVPCGGFRDLLCRRRWLGPSLFRQRPAAPSRVLPSPSVSSRPVLMLPETFES